MALLIECADFGDGLPSMLCSGSLDHYLSISLWYSFHIVAFRYISLKSLIFGRWWFSSLAMRPVQHSCILSNVALIPVIFGTFKDFRVYDEVTLIDIDGIVQENECVTISYSGRHIVQEKVTL